MSNTITNNKMDSEDDYEFPCSQKRLVHKADTEMPCPQKQVVFIDDDEIEEELGRFLDQLIKEQELKKDLETCNNCKNK